MELFKLWDAVCNGDIKILKQYYENGGEINQRYKAFGSEHSLIAGAYRNNNYATVKYLLSVGETVMDKEKKEISATKLQKIKEAKLVLDCRTSDNSSLDNYGDFVRCTNCGKLMLVDLREEICPECCTDGSLMWVDEIQEHDEVSLEEAGYLLSSDYE